MKKRVFLILKEDIIYYPPVLSLIRILRKLDYRVYHIGVYTDKKQKEYLESQGVTFLQTLQYKGNANPFIKLLQQWKFRRQVNSFLKRLSPTETDYVWLIQAETVCLLNSLIFKYKTIVHLFEYVEPHINFKYRLLNPTFKMSVAMREAYKVICCEYNRSQITKGLFQLKELPIVLPNKFYLDEKELENPPTDVMDIVNDIHTKIEGKKVILYQGSFLEKDRRLEEFCQAIDDCPDDYVLLAMGPNVGMYRYLKGRYSSNKIIFLPFIRPPFHLLVTKLASIGVLSYFPKSKNVASVINPLYCAPNKIFEYSRYGIPMVSNDVPGLYYIYMEYKCGECISYPLTPGGIKKAILKIFDNYEMYSQGAYNYYNSINIANIINKILT